MYLASLRLSAASFLLVTASRTGVVERKENSSRKTSLSLLALTGVAEQKKNSVAKLYVVIVIGNGPVTYVQSWPSG